MLPFKKKVTVGWIRDSSNSSQLVWRIPNEKFPKISRAGEVVVKEFEKAIFFKGGSMEGIWSPGKHQIPKEVDEVIWVDISPKQQPFGIPKYNGPITKDGYQMGLSGAITLRVNGDLEKNVAQFLSRLVAGSNTYNRDQLADWLREGPLVSVFRDVAKKLTYQEFMQMNREELLNHEVRPRLYNELYRYGLDLISIDLTSSTTPQKVI